jgi:hypothetical protein
LDVSAMVRALPFGLAARDCAQLVRRNQDPGLRGSILPISWLRSKFAVPLSTSITPIGPIVEVRSVAERSRSPLGEHDAHLHLHAEMVRRKSDIGAVKRDRVARIGDNRNGDKVDVADAAACWIEINPSGTR